MITETTESEAGLAAGLQIRPAQWADAQPVAQLVLDVCTADGDPTAAQTVEEIEHFWKMPGVSLERDAWVVRTTDGRAVGYEEFYSRYAHVVLSGDGYVHPDFQGRGIGTTMLRALEQRARLEIPLAEADLRVCIRNMMATTDSVGRAMHEAEGYSVVRYSWRMEITLEAAPVPAWPEGLELRPFELERHNRAVFEAHEAAFRDHWGHTPGTYEHWQHNVSGRADLDATLWFIAWDRAEIAGYVLCRYRMGIGFVGTLGVRQPWRRRGLGEALLVHSFAEFFRRGMPTIGLGVDAENPTGATRLYKKAGMHIAAEYVLYEKELRAGREPAESE
jgi:ribosomal protein S18 acetylase RimI-like enzyme